jgi:hypothetical protein
VSFVYRCQCAGLAGRNSEKVLSRCWNSQKNWIESFPDQKSWCENKKSPKFSGRKFVWPGFFRNPQIMIGTFPEKPKNPCERSLRAKGGEGCPPYPVFPVSLITDPPSSGLNMGSDCPFQTRKEARIALRLKTSPNQPYFGNRAK